MFKSHVLTQKHKRPPTHPNYPQNSCHFSKVKFLDANESLKVLLQSNYTQNWTVSDFIARAGYNPQDKQQAIKDYYKQGLDNWEPWEKEEIRSYLSGLCTFLKNWGLSNIFSQRSLVFIKTKHEIDFSAPYTLAPKYIIINQKQLSRMAKARRQGDHLKIEKGIITLCHEIIHLIQKEKRGRPIFDYLIKKYFHLHIQDVFIPPAFMRQLLTNPDVIYRNYQKPTSKHPYYKVKTWVFTISKGTIGSGTPTGFGGYQHYLPTMFLYRGQKRGVLLGLETDLNEQFYVTGPIFPVELIQKYRELYFGFDRQIDHPDEALANLISEYIVSGEVYHGNPTLRTTTSMSQHFYPEMIKMLSKL